MEPAEETAPPVVAVMVVHEPGAWFTQVLIGLAHQDYPNLRHLFLVTGDPGDVHEQIRRRLPGSFVRTLDGDPGYGAAANEVLRLVEGENGFFLLLHDDVALDPSAIRLLVEEMYRSNAGIVGPKLVDWDDQRLLQHVGLGVDRFGEIDPFVDPGEADQEQHDAVRDVFALPSACILIRADLFRILDGFDPALRFYGDDVDLCWRAHLGGARVVVVPGARARHRERLADRRPDLRHAALQARHRMRAVATLTGARRLPWVLVQLVFVTFAELVIGLLTAAPRQAIASIQAMFGMVPRIPSIIRRRRQIAALRHVPAGEVAGLQVRGSARLSSYMRSRDRRPLDAEASTERRWRQTAGSAPAITWFVALAALVIGSRSLISGGVPAFGELLRYPSSPGAMLDSYRSGWSAHGLGTTSAVPTGIGLIAIGSTLTLFHMGLWHTVGLLGMLVIGYAGMWRLGALFPQPRARIIGLLVYAAIPLSGELLSTGRWSALACFAATPWIVHLLRRAAGIETIGAAGTNEVERYADIGLRKRIRILAQLALLVAATLAFAPSFVIVVVGIGAILAVTTLLSFGSWRIALVLAGCAAAVVVVAWLANLPWSATLIGKGTWTSIVGVPPAGTHSLGVIRLARFGVGTGPIGVLALVLYLPVVVAPLVARGWRLTWAVRAAGLVVGFGFLLVLDDRGSLFVRMPEPGVLLAPVAVGVALAAACIAAAFQEDVLGGSFGWRQPLGLLSALAIVVGVIPGIAAIGDGRWRMPELTLSTVLDQLPAHPTDGDYRVLWLGDPRVIPVASWAYAPGIGYAITDDGPLQIQDDWPGIPTEVEHEVTAAVDAIRSETTLRVGRLLAPYGIRYIVVPIADGARSTLDKPLPVPAGLLDALNDQLDLGTPLTSPLNFAVFENTAWTPTRSQLSGNGIAASKEGGAAALTKADLRGSQPFAVGAPLIGPAIGPVSPGTLHLAVPYDEHWKLTVDGVAVPSRRAFGTTMAFDVTTAGTARLTYDTSPSRTALLLVQLVIWLALLVAASRLNPSAWRRWRGPDVSSLGGPVVTIHDPILRPGGDEPWLPAPAEETPDQPVAATDAGPDPVRANPRDEVAT
ncbi:MAG: glycosyltransferase family 2 protein [Ilumatobacteraceae bacterium]